VQRSEDRLEVSVREAFVSDASRIVSLALQLGYTVSLERTQKYLALADAGRHVFVAVVPRAGVVGWIALSVRETLTTARQTIVEGLVVEDEYRSNGIGAALLARGETWARESACGVVCVRSNVTRERARAFYERRGYDTIKTQAILTKSL
jgi:GNAT superfamily N-acetyltransferase